MGYRSKVCLSARNEAAQMLVQSMLFREIADEKHSHQKEGVLYAFAMVESAKWYEHDPTYPEVEEITKLRSEHFDDVNFVRAGEEFDDIEAQIGFWDDPYDVQPSVDICWRVPEVG